jgi:hypothetical protein
MVPQSLSAEPGPEVALMEPFATVRRWLRSRASTMSRLIRPVARGDRAPGGGVRHLAHARASAGSTPAGDDEFVGPFPSWTNLKTVPGGGRWRHR